MSFKSLLIKSSINNCLRQTSPLLLSCREGHTVRGKPPGVAKTLEQRLREENVQDAEINARVNIGFPKLRPSRSQQLKERLEHLKVQRANSDLQKQARNHSLRIDLEKVQQQYRNSTGQYDLRLMADHYGIFKDLFGLAYFVPRVPLSIKYAHDNYYCSVYNGNVIKPIEARQQPEVAFDGQIDPITGKKSTNDTFWTLIATNPDAHFSSNDAEYLHWFVANIPNGDVKQGETIANYLPPFPAKGIGYQRFIYVLYKQQTKLDFAAHKIEEPNNCINLEARTFKTLDFYRKYQDELTPAGLCFFQSDWDKSLTEFYHKVLQMKEPIFEYDFPAAYLSDQKHFPLKQPFNLYMDKHRDQQQLNKEYLERKLAKTHPFEGPEPALRFPNAHSLRGLPSWLKTEVRKQRLGIGRINDY